MEGLPTTTTKNQANDAGAGNWQTHSLKSEQKAYPYLDEESKRNLSPLPLKRNK